MRVPEIEVTEVKSKLDSGHSFTFIDVREPNEHRCASIPGAKLIPLGEFHRCIAELDPDSEIIIHCRSGARSGRACGMLLEQGFTNVRNMKGGILAWSDQVDPSVPKY
jgi:sulfur-carrier protein adenylyltransferase/sulfurtransferase